MKKKQTAKLIPLLATGMMPPAAMTSALLSPPALGAPGDLDPAFGDVGRLGPILDGPAWSLEPLEDGTLLLGGGLMYSAYCGWYCYYYEPVTTNFISRFSETGSTDAEFAAASLEDSQVIDIARQADGQIVAVGRKVHEDSTASQLIVFRLHADGPLDTTFGVDGIFELSLTEHGDSQIATSVVVDPDGRIVVAGSRGNQAIVLRLLPDGSLDDSFATSGIFAGPDTYDFAGDNAGARTSILRAAAGGYRVTASNAAGCQVIALTEGGAMDAAFGTSGIATAEAPSGPSTACNSMAAQADGRILLAGNAAGRGFAARLLADGQPDPTFSADAVTDAMEDATAVAVGQDGSVAVAGKGVSGESIMRLLANGELDALFGNGGSTLIDLHSEAGTSPVVHDMIVRADGSVVAAGGDDYSNKAFIVRLLGASGGDSPGVLGFAEQNVVSTAEGTQEVVVNVRRTGGFAGSVSLAYETALSDWQDATDGEDYLGVSGRLTWEDGSGSEQQIHIPILSDDSTEDYQYFNVVLSDVQDGAGLGTSHAIIEIAADGKPFGQLSFSDATYTAQEGRTIEVAVTRNYYASGAVSVTVTPIAGSATSNDFTAGPVTVSWAEDDWDWKVVEIPIVDDPYDEPIESFTVALSDPTGGAVIGWLPSATVQIAANDETQVSSGGGAVGFLSLLLLGAMSFRRSSPVRRLRSMLATRAGPGFSSRRPG